MNAQRHDTEQKNSSGRREGGFRLRLFFRLIALRASSSLVRRIVVLNLAGLVALLAGFLYINQFRQGLIEARVESLLTQGEIMASAVAASATIEIDSITIDPEKLLLLQAGESAIAGDDSTEFSINPENVAPLLRRLVTPTRTRARIYDQDGELLIDTAAMYSRGDIMRFDLPPPETEDRTLIARTWDLMTHRLGNRVRESKEDFNPSHGRSIAEVSSAFNGAPASIVRVNGAGETIVSVAVPIQRSRVVRGVLLLSTLGGDIDGIIRTERFSILRVFAVAAAAMLIVSAFFAGTIVGPIRRLSSAADRVRRGLRTREEIPDLTNRSDEIGHLSGSLRDMTRTLYDRIEAIESFAADVAHELKNPLTSLRSAVETWPLAKNDESRIRLLDVIKHDVQRLDRLISDISNASRLDAELARVDAEPVDVLRLAETVVDVANSIRSGEQIKTHLIRGEGLSSPQAATIIGYDSRLGQVLNNLIDNAKSFSEPHGEIRVTVTRERDAIIITVDDDGPGVPSHAFEKIFNRFYTDRPNGGFGENSGLGLSISRQIIEAHRGRIWAENRVSAQGQVEGARFTVRLPAGSA
ncbi:MAG: stimulus-sensing domain-containing protein [Hyphomicrobiales bacterium]